MKKSILRIHHSIIIPLLLLVVFGNLYAQDQKLWHNQERQIHYKPEGKSFVLANGNRKFNRALYGTNTGFRVETGDLPEFALYMPGMGGNFKLGIATGSQSKWITEADSIHTKYTPGVMEYEIRDQHLGNGFLKLTVLASADNEGFLLKVEEQDLPKSVVINWLFGGASGKKFHRDGDIGADPESVFYLQPEYCRHNEYHLKKEGFSLDFNWDKKTNTNKRKLLGSVPSGKLNIGNALAIQNFENLKNSTPDSLPVVYGTLARNASKTYYWNIQNATDATNHQTKSRPELAFEKALKKANELAATVTLSTPDPYLNTLGGALATAADAIWENPAYLHGSVAWRMHLNAWRGAYAADLLGWHDRAKTHFTSYGKSQVLEPETGPVVLDTSRNFARQKEVLGTALFSRGYISRHPNRNDRAHHYDMNLVFIDQLLTHFKWNQDSTFLKEIFPVIERHLEWEKRNYDANNDGLYDAYAAIWASDALQYSGGSVTYTSAYNYRANTRTAQLAKILGKDPQPYVAEAEKIKQAIEKNLWLPNKGVYAEYKDALGNQLLHKNPGIWTIYHAIDKQVPDAFQAQMALNYIKNEIPHIPIHATGLPHPDLELVSTTNWQPYTWSVNNVALAENLNTALAFWQGGNTEAGFKLFESALIESMYLGASPGGFQQLSFYDAIRGELYRDFADPIGVASRALVEGLFGIQPNVSENQLLIKPGFPEEWDQASLALPDVEVSFKKSKTETIYTIKNKFNTALDLNLELNSTATSVQEVLVNGKRTSFEIDSNAVGTPKLKIAAGTAPSYTIQIKTGATVIEKLKTAETYTAGSSFEITTEQAEILELKDLQNTLTDLKISAKKRSGKVQSDVGNKTIFIKLKQDEMIWWQPVKIKVKPVLEIRDNKYQNDEIKLDLMNNTPKDLRGNFTVNDSQNSSWSISANTTQSFKIPKASVVSGTNTVLVTLTSGEEIPLQFTNWDIPASNQNNLETVPLSDHFNATVNSIFEPKYLSPRPDTPTLQLPITGIGNWCYPNVADDVVIDDTGLRTKAGSKGFIVSPQQIPFATKSNTGNNVVFTSQWDTYPNSVSIPISGKAQHAYLMMTGTTNPMQTQMTNGSVTITYTDNTQEVLELKNPENWWPIEQDYYTDGYAFKTNAPKPPRVIFKTGDITRDFKNYSNIHGFTNYGIESGAGTIVDLPLDPKKTLKNLKIESHTNDVVIGLMSLTLQRN